MNDALKTVVDALRLSLAPREIGPSDNCIFVPEGFTLKDAESFQPVPRRKRGTCVLQDIASLCAYITEHKNPSSRVFVNWVTGASLCILDFHAEDPAWMQHIATWNPEPSPAWSEWCKHNGRQMDQKTFAEFAEDHLADFENPPGGEMFDIITTLQASGRLNFRQAVRIDNSTIKLTYEETIDAKAGQKGELNVPQVFALGIELYPGMGTTTIQARLRYKIQDGQLTFTFKLQDMERITRAAVDRIVQTIKAETGLAVFLGRFDRLNP